VIVFYTLHLSLLEQARLYTALVLAGASAIVLFIAVTGFDADTASVLFSMGAVIKLPGGSPEGLRGAVLHGTPVQPGDSMGPRLVGANGRPFMESWGWQQEVDTRYRRVLTRVWCRVRLENVSMETLDGLEAQDAREAWALLAWASSDERVGLSQRQSERLYQLTVGAQSDSYDAGWIACRVEQLRAEHCSK